MLLILGLAALLLVPFPVSGHKESEHSLETGVAINQLIEKKTPSWDSIVEAQLKRKAEQDLKAQQEAERQRQIEASKRAEQARLAQTPKSVPKVAQKAPIVARIVSYANTYSPGYCTWFVASRRPVPSGWGNARNWLANARAAGFATGSVPRVGAIAWTGAGAMGHVAYTERVEGNRALISEMNYNGLGVVSQRWVSFSEFTWIY